MQDSDIFLEELKPVKIYLSLGSNMGDRWHNLETALKSLSLKIKVLTVSGIYNTMPVGNLKQKRFLNLVCEAETVLYPQSLLSFAKQIEQRMGRQPGPVDSPRPIDIDILIYGNQIVNTSELIIPHPRLAERAFVLVPLAEIAPDFIHPVSGKKIKEILATLQYNANDVIKLENTRGELCTK